MLAVKLVLFGLLSLCLTNATASPDSTVLVHSILQTTDTFPAPPNTKDLLFYIQRTSNTNTIIYDVNAPDGKLDVDDPIHVYWIRYAEEGHNEELSYVQRSFAYGVNVKAPNAGVAEFSFVSYKKMKMYLQYSDADKKFIVWIQRAGKKIKVSRFFVKIDGGTFWFPKVTFIEIKGVEIGTGKDYLERFKP